ncbi:phosphate signaling complex protein PhoU [Corynebacterium tapiri]|uniref:Phosphate-specific transport system accessory protein PhoU n=1 Tax=Corynebacterium tapiri TaxID=1448266 RepID=A0A5C4U270_9CORY|nr:phosphate signaling complex protein PhoU [Corynebacterium tapiri]TNL96113.1 phosphate signaling complex protein PhoU [Corynebacterium tapiri]
MRTAYRSELDDFANDLVTMCEGVRESMNKATYALLRPSLMAAEEALSMSDDLDELRRRGESRAIELLALESPVAGDLRQVISSIHMVRDLDRMSSLSIHIATAARNRHPEPAISEPLSEKFSTMARLVDSMAEKTRELLITHDTDMALALSEEDDAIDAAAADILSIVTGENWTGTTREAVEAALLARYFERWADHCVNVGKRIVFLTTGQDPEEVRAPR